jgi:hypothetical protein
MQIRYFFAGLCQEIRGPLVSDAYLAALAIEHGCELVTTDGDFARFPGLRWRHPLAAGSEPRAGVQFNRAHRRYTTVPLVVTWLSIAVFVAIVTIFHFVPTDLDPFDEV